jgi:ParB-like chromosome segregation protein Spo0J
MADDKKAPAVPERATPAATKPAKVPLNEFLLLPERYCHRDEQELTDIERLRPLVDSIAAEGLQTPPEFFRDEKGRPVIVKGHRRISALRWLADKGTAGFKPNMPVEAIEVSGATLEDLLVRSIIDNVNRLTLSPTERIRAAKAMKDRGVKPERAAATLGISVKTYSRMLLIAENDWMFDLVNKHSVPISYAPLLLEVATKEGRLAELQTDLTEWVAAKDKEIKEQIAAQKKLSAAKQLVKTYVTKPLVDHWVAQLRKKEKLDAEIPKDTEIAIDPDKNQVSINVNAIDMMKTPLPELAKLVSEIESAKQVMVQYLKTRHAIKGPQDVARAAKTQSGGLEFLRKEGLGDLVDDMELKSMEEAETAEGSAEESEGEATEDT